jgi:hypothetical protein
VIKRACCCVFALSLYCAAVDSDQVRYVGGTIDGAKAGAIGHLAFSSEALTFAAPATLVAVPFRSMESFDYSQEVKHHLGVLPAVVVGMVRKRKRGHYFRISFRDDRNSTQVVIFEVSKGEVRNVQTVLAAKAHQACVSYGPCPQQK